MLARCPEHLQPPLSKPFWRVSVADSAGGNKRSHAGWTRNSDRLMVLMKEAGQCYDEDNLKDPIPIECWQDSHEYVCCCVVLLL